MARKFESKGSNVFDPLALGSVHYNILIVLIDFLVHKCCRLGATGIEAKAYRTEGDNFIYCIRNYQFLQLFFV